jgi:MFS family permease
MTATVMQNLVLPMQFISLTFWAIDTYPGQKVAISGLLVATRGAGMLLFSFIGGAVADRFERRRVLLACEAVACATTALIALCMLTQPLGSGTIVAILALVFLAAAITSIDGPARSASIPVIVGVEDMTGAIGINNVAQQITFPAVFPLVGFLNGVIGPGGVLAWSLLAWAVSVPCVLALRYSSRALVRRPGGILPEIRAGLGYARRDTVIFAVVGMVVVMQVVGMPGVGALGPVWMTQVLGLSTTQFGFVGMLWGLGAVAASFFFARFGNVTRDGRTLAVMVLLFGTSAVIFGHSRVVALTAVANFGLGFAVSGAIVAAMTIVQHAAAEEFRGRVMGLFPLVMGLSMLNVGPVSVTAQVVGLELVVPLLGWATLALAAALAAASPTLRGGKGPPQGKRVAVETAKATAG